MCADGSQSCGPLDIEMAFGDPAAMEKAAAVMALHENCPDKRMHCPWHSICKSDPTFLCPIDLDERRQDDKTL